MLLNPLAGWGNFRCWYRDTIRRYLQVITNSPFFMGLIFNQLIGIHNVIIRKLWLTQLTNRTVTVFHHDPFFPTTHRRIFVFLTSQQKIALKNPKAAKGLVPLWLLGAFWRLWTWEFPSHLSGGSRLGFFKVPLWGHHRTWENIHGHAMNEEYLSLFHTCLFPCI